MAEGPILNTKRLSSHNCRQMRIGLIARADNAGLGAQTWEFYRHMQPSKTVVVDMSRETRMPWYPDRYTGSPVVSLHGWLSNEDLIAEFLQDLDVVYTAETPYNWAVFRIARRMGVKTVLHANYEFLDYAVEDNLPPCDELWMSSLWNYDRVPYQSWDIPGCRYVPTPVDRQRCQLRRPPEDERASVFLHICGQETILDRNGTEAVLGAIPRVQSRDVQFLFWSPRHIHNYVEHQAWHDPRVKFWHHNVEDYWRLYDQGDVLLLPRRYGGQSLQMQEALSSGFPVISTDVDPQTWFLPEDWRISCRHQQQFRAKTYVECYQPSVQELAEKIDWFATRPLLPESEKADKIAESLSWDLWSEKYREIMKELIDG